MLIAAQLALVLQPLSALAHDKGDRAFNPVAGAQVQRIAQLDQRIQQARAQRAQAEKSPADQVSDKLAQAEELVHKLRRTGTPDKTTKHQQLKGLLADINTGTTDVRAEFAATRSRLQAKGLPASILQRHDDAVAKFEERSARFNQIAQIAGDDDRVKALDAFYAQYPAKRKPLPLGKKLPWSTPDANKRMPAETKTAWFRNLYGDQQVRLAQAGGNVGPIQFNILPDPSVAPTMADLAETDEIVLTDGIKAKAAALGNNAVNIFNFVRNNIEWAPTAGAIQSAQDTLDKQRGNATDTATLLIALLRAAHIPARYQWGTMDVPADRAMNWVGGATVPQAALQILNQGGIAARGIGAGGQITTIRMEHVWVSAYVNWTPSRGNRQGGGAANPQIRTPDGQLQHVNPNANLNAWVPLDGAFKLYTYTPGMNLQQAVPLDANALLTAAQQGATVNTQEGWVQNLNQAAIQTQLQNYQAQLQAYINSTATGANSTVGDVIGKKIIAASAPNLLAGVIPNPIVAQTAQASSIPSNLEHKFTYSLYASDTDQANGNSLLSYTEKTSKLVGKRLTITYVPATQADADVIASYLPQPHADGSPIQPSELPTSLPGYLINLKAQINLDGQVVAQAKQVLPMGTDLYSTGGFTQLYDTSQWDLSSEETHTVGNVTAIGVSAGGLSLAQLVKARSTLTSQEASTAKTSILASTPTGEALAGTALTAAALAWFARAESLVSVASAQAAILHTWGMSYGLIHGVVNPIPAWGVIRYVTFPGVNLDVGHTRLLDVSAGGDVQGAAAFNRGAGFLMSATEGAVLEQIFSDRSQCNVSKEPTPSSQLPACTHGVSAIAAIALAAQSGQKLYTLTQQQYLTNPAAVQSAISRQSVAVQNRVAQALAAGYEVTIHETPVTIGSWNGAGITIIDPSTGSGAYLLDATSNGGFIQFLGALLQDPGLLRTPCGQSMLADTIDKFVATNNTIPGWSLPPGATIVTAATVVNELGGLTFLGFLQLSMRNPLFLTGNLAVWASSALENNLLMGGAFEVGLLIGSGVSAAVCKGN